MSQRENWSIPRPMKSIETEDSIPYRQKVVLDTSVGVTGIPADFMLGFFLVCDHIDTALRSPIVFPGKQWENDCKRRRFALYWKGKYERGE